jgi:hypothetical protein
MVNDGLGLDDHWATPEPMLSPLLSIAAAMGLSFVVSGNQRHGCGSENYLDGCFL